MSSIPLLSAPLSLRSLALADLPLLQEWLGRPHVSHWWGEPPTLAQVEDDFAPMLQPESTTRGHIALLAGEPVGFIQSYVVKDSGDGWWEGETDPGARGIDQFLAHAHQLNQGLGSRLIRAFVAQLFEDPGVSVIQTDPSPDNTRAIRSYLRAGFRIEYETDTPDGRAVLMRCLRADLASS